MIVANASHGPASLYHGGNQFVIDLIATICAVGGGGEGVLR